MTIIHNGQRRTCYKCGQVGHMVKDCAADMTESPRMFNEEDFPQMKSKDVNEQENIASDEPIVETQNKENASFAEETKIETREGRDEDADV